MTGRIEGEASRGKRVVRSCSPADSVEVDGHDADARALDTVDGLRRDGWVIDYATVAMTGQVEGALPTGERFYFHAKHDTLSVAVGGDYPSAGAPWVYHETYGAPGGEDASYLTVAQCLQHARRLAQLYGTGTPSSNGW
jgi:hypothetical protein